MREMRQGLDGAADVLRQADEEVLSPARLEQSVPHSMRRAEQLRRDVRKLRERDDLIEVRDGPSAEICPGT